MFVDIYNTDKQYNIIYADPPWRYNQRNNKKTKFGGGVHSHYPTMSMEEIEKLPIEKLAGENCALFLWTTCLKADAVEPAPWDVSIRNKVVALDEHMMNHGFRDIAHQLFYVCKQA